MDQIVRIFLLKLAIKITFYYTSLAAINDVDIAQVIVFNSKIVLENMTQPFLKILNGNFLKTPCTHFPFLNQLQVFGNFTSFLCKSEATKILSYVFEDPVIMSYTFYIVYEQCRVLYLFISLNIIITKIRKIFQ